MGLLVGKELESRDLASYNSDDGPRVVRACVGESKLIQVNPSFPSAECGIRSAELEDCVDSWIAGWVGVLRGFGAIALNPRVLRTGVSKRPLCSIQANPS
jgi:hypothetical protein